MKRGVLVGAALTAGVGAVEFARRRDKKRYFPHESATIAPVEHPEENSQSNEEFVESPDQQRKLFGNLKWPTLLGNIGIGAAEVLAGGSSTLAVTVDGVHNLGDAAGYGVQFYAEEAKRPERVHRLRKIGHWIIASSSAAVGAKAAYDLATQNEHVAHPAGLVAAGASLALNGYLGRDIIPKVRRVGWRKMTSTQRDIAKHFLFVDAPSSVLAVGGAVAAGAAAHEAGAGAAVVSGAVGAWVFRPTKRNLAEPHSCVTHGYHDDHAHSHTDESHVHHHPEKRDRNISRRRRVALLGAACVAAAGAVVGAIAPAAHGPDVNAQEAPVSMTQVDRNDLSAQTTPQESIMDAARLHTVQEGESLWTIVEDTYCQKKECSNQEIVNKIDDIVERNSIDTPDLIFPSQRLAL